MWIVCRGEKAITIVKTKKKFLELERRRTSNKQSVQQIWHFVQLKTKARKKSEMKKERKREKKQEIWNELNSGILYKTQGCWNVPRNAHDVYVMCMHFTTAKLVHCTVHNTYSPARVHETDGKCTNGSAILAVFTIARKKRDFSHRESSRQCMCGFC